MVVSKSLIKSLIVLWQLPQFLLGFLIMVLSDSSPIHKEDTNHWYFQNPFGDYGLSLSYFIFLTEDFSDDGVRHEQGHTKQSEFLGPLYLIVVGLPSAILFLIYRLKGKSFSWYHSKFPEKWADKLGKAYDYNK